ncbi:MAG: amino acid ABC transporter permease [Micromonosporaceae bacterium]
MSQNSSVLYDAPGPRTRRLTVIASVVIAVLIAAGVYFFIYQPLAERGEFTMDKWGPLIDPDDPEFAPLWKRLGKGFRATLTAAALAIVSSLVLGTALAVLRVQLRALQRRRFADMPTAVALALRALSWLITVVTRFCLEVFRGLPVVITIFFVWVILPDLGIELSLLWYLVIGLTIYNMVVIGEILRSGMEGLPGGQVEAAQAIGLTSFQTTRMVLLPQGFRVMLPALISQLVVVLKDTSLGFIIGYEEIMRVARQVIPVLETPNTIQLYFVVGVIYITANYLLSKLAEYVQRRLSRARKTGTLAPPPTQPLPPAAITAQAAAGTSGGASH